MVIEFSRSDGVKYKLSSKRQTIFVTEIHHNEQDLNHTRIFKEKKKKCTGVSNDEKHVRPKLRPQYHYKTKRQYCNATCPYDMAIQKSQRANLYDYHKNATGFINDGINFKAHNDEINRYEEAKEIKRKYQRQRREKVLDLFEKNRYDMKRIKKLLLSDCERAHTSSNAWYRLNSKNLECKELLGSCKKYPTSYRDSKREIEDSSTKQSILFFERDELGRFHEAIAREKQTAKANENLIKQNYEFKEKVNLSKAERRERESTIMLRKQIGMKERRKDAYLMRVSLSQKLEKPRRLSYFGDAYVEYYDTG